MRIEACVKQNPTEKDMLAMTVCPKFMKNKWGERLRLGALKTANTKDYEQKKKYETMLVKQREVYQEWKGKVDKARQKRLTTYFNLQKNG
jgi:hypothetical protein